MPEKKAPSAAKGAGPSALLAKRLRNQQLVSPKLKSPGDAVRWLGAVQSQDYSGGKWSLGIRLPNATDIDVEKAIAQKEFVRTWTLRGTLHFIPAEDVRWQVDLTAPSLIRRSAARLRQLELDAKTLSKSNDLIAKAVRGNKQQTRRELLAMLEKNGVTTTGQRAPHILQWAAIHGLVCQTHTVKNDPTYVTLDEWLPKAKTLPKADALARLSKSYFQSHGPATAHDFAWWLGLTLTDARAGLEAVQAKLTQEVIDGKTYYLADTGVPTVPSPVGFLLQAYDEFGSYKDRLAAIDVEHLQYVFLSNGLTGTIMLNGRVIGTWKRTIDKKGVHITLSYFKQHAKLPAAQSQAIVGAAKSYAAFLGVPLARTATETIGASS